MMYKLMMRFLPADKRALLELAMLMVAAFDTQQKRLSIATYAKEVLADGKISVAEWAQLGSKCGLLTGPGRPKRSERV